MNEKKRSYALKDLKGRAKRNRGFTLIMNTLEQFTPREQDILLQELSEELDEQRSQQNLKALPIDDEHTRG